MTAYLLGSNRILLNSPAMTKAIRQLENGQDQFSFGRAAFLQSSLQGQTFNRGSILGRRGQVEDSLLWVWLTAPAVPGKRPTLEKCWDDSIWP